MLTRRGFTGFATCAICAVTDFIASGASAQNAPPANGGITRKIKSQMDGPAAGYVTINMEVGIEAGAVIPRHTHPGIESGYVVEGSLELPIDGQPTLMLKAGDGFQVPTAVPHAGGKASDKKTTLALTYVVEKDKPLASPA
ncbi:MAG TPA: cupin domain-containing protein [Xanthobacteraceae bacterium]|jgi:quercetin dioxygenase-like cupin family protein|nr:cupin domain-containing protein [Xanthobacteraceae bacterium]